MTADELNKLYADLEIEETSLREQLSTIANKNPMVRGDFQVRVPNYGADETDDAQEVADLDRNLALERELESRLKEINAVMKKIKDGTYGRCETCSIDIPVARLKVQPVASLCIACAKLIR